MSMNGNQSDLSTILRAVEALFEEQVEKIAVTTETLRAQTKELQRLRAMLRAGGIEGETKKKEKPTSAKAVKKETLTEILNLARHVTSEQPPILEGVPRSFTTGMLAAETGLSPATIRLGLESLREAGAVRLAGMDTSGGGRAAKVYALVSA